MTLGGIFLQVSQTVGFRDIVTDPMGIPTYAPDGECGIQRPEVKLADLWAPDSINL